MHTARETYGADLISLVRVFNDPENGNCGIAWLGGGGGQSGFEQETRWAAYDGVLDPEDYGAFSYSFGFKSGAGEAGNFYTVMAYGDTGQTAYRCSPTRASATAGASCAATAPPTTPPA
jgi:hypothetical protein